MSTLHTSRLALVPITERHGDELHRLHTDLLVVNSILDGESPSIDNTRQRLAQYLADWEREGFGFWMIYHKQLRPWEFVGRAGLRRFAGTTDLELGYCFFEAACGNGFATEAARAITDYAFNVLRADRLVAVVRPENRVSINVLAKLGFQFDDARTLGGKLKYHFSLKPRPQ